MDERVLVVRIDEIGRAQAVTYDSLSYRPTGQAPELKYFLVQFVTKHYGRMRATVKAQYAESLTSWKRARRGHDRPRSARTHHRAFPDRHVGRD